MSKPPKLDRKELKKPDEFVEGGRKLFFDLLEKKTTLYAFIGGVLAIVVFVYVYDWYVSSKLEKEWAQYFESIQEDEPLRWEKLKALAEKSSLRPSQMAAVQLGDHYFTLRQESLLKGTKTQESEENGKSAIQWYSKALGFSGLSDFEEQLLQINRAGVYEMEGNFEAALVDLEQAEKSGGDIRPLALLQMGRVLEQKGDLPKAKETYQKVAVEYSETEFAKTAKNYSRALNSPLFNLTEKGS